MPVGAFLWAQLETLLTLPWSRQTSYCNMQICRTLQDWGPPMGAGPTPWGVKECSEKEFLNSVVIPLTFLLIFEPGALHF